MFIARALPLLGSIFAIIPTTIRSADQLPTDSLTRLTSRGKLLFGKDLQQPLDPSWKTAKGKWELIDGAIRGSELKADMHGAVTRHPMAARDVVIEYSFKLDGARQTSLSINGEKGHICRVALRPNGFSVQKDDQDGKNGPDKGVVLDTCATAIKPGEWHTICIEIQGKTILATLDGKHVAFGEHDAIDKPKANLGFTVSGESVSFKNLRVWEAMPNKDWAATRAKLLKERAK